MDEWYDANRLYNMLGEALSPHERGQVKRKASGQPSQMEVDEEAAEASEEDIFWWKRPTWTTPRTLRVERARQTGERRDRSGVSQAVSALTCTSAKAAFRP